MGRRAKVPTVPSDSRFIPGSEGYCEDESTASTLISYKIGVWHPILNSLCYELMLHHEAQGSDTCGPDRNPNG